MSTDGFWLETISSGDETYVATAARAVPGRPVAFTDLSDVTMWAQAVGLLHAASGSYAPSPVSTRLGMIAGALPTLTDLWAQIQSAISDDPQLQAQFEDGSRWLARQSEPTLVTHGDVRPQNTVVCDGGVVLLDFDEPTWAWAPYDLARMMLDDDGSPAVDASRHAAAIRDGYERARPLVMISHADIEHLLRIRVLLMYGWSLQDPSGADPAWLGRLRTILERPE